MGVRPLLRDADDYQVRPPLFLSLWVPSPEGPSSRSNSYKYGCRRTSDDPGVEYKTEMWV